MSTLSYHFPEFAIGAARARARRCHPLRTPQQQHRRAASLELQAAVKLKSGCLSGTAYTASAPPCLLPPDPPAPPKPQRSPRSDSVEGRKRVTCAAQTRRAVGPRCSTAAPDERELPRRLSAGRRRRHRCGRSVLSVVPEATTQRSPSVRTMVIINDGFITNARRASSHAEAGW